MPGGSQFFNTPPPGYEGYRFDIFAEGRFAGLPVAAQHIYVELANDPTQREALSPEVKAAVMRHAGVESIPDTPASLTEG